MSTPFSWSSISVGRIAETGHWMLTYQRSSNSDWLVGPDYQRRAWDERIMIRFATSPMAIGSGPEVALFDPFREFSRGHYMYRSGIEDPNDLADQKPVLGGESFAYGAYLLSHFTEWNANDRTVSLVYTLSTARPYQVQIMKSRITVPDTRLITQPPLPVYSVE
jgi:hypothetical protein